MPYSKDGDASTECVQCTNGTYVPAGKSGSCSKFECVAGTRDHDEDPATPCAILIMMVEECTTQSTTTPTSTVTSSPTTTTTPTTTTYTTSPTTITVTSTATTSATSSLTTSQTTTATSTPTTSHTTSPTTTTTPTTTTLTSTGTTTMHMTSTQTTTATEFVVPDAWFREAAMNAQSCVQLSWVVAIIGGAFVTGSLFGICVVCCCWHPHDHNNEVNNMLMNNTLETRKESEMLGFPPGVPGAGGDDSALQQQELARRLSAHFGSDVGSHVSSADGYMMTGLNDDWHNNNIIY